MAEPELRTTYLLDRHRPIQVRSLSLSLYAVFLILAFLRPYGYNVPYRKLFQAYEDIVGRYQGRPHWAKAHQLGPDSLQKLYPHFGEFRRVIEDVDPKGIFRNDYVQRHIMGHSIGRRIYKNP